MANVSSSNGLEKRPRLAFRNTDGSHFSCWRQTSLGCIIEPYSEKVYGEHDYEVLTSAREGLQRQEDHFGSKQRHDTDGYNIIPFGYCTYRNRSDDGKFAFNINTISEKAIVSKFYPVFRFTNANSTFMAEFLNSSPRVKKKLSVLAVGTSQVVLSFEALKAAKFDLPCKDEQDKIAAFLECLNTRIENQRTLIVALKKYKRGLLSQLIAQKKAFDTSGEWKTVKLGHIFKERTERAKGNGTLLAVTISNGVQRRDEIDLKDNSSDDKSNYKCVYIGDIAYNTMRMWQGASGVSPYNGIVSPAYTIVTPIRPDLHNMTFWAYYFKYSPLVQTFQKYSQGLTSDTWNLKFPQFSEIAVTMPPISEQDKIAECLSVFDEHCKCEDEKLQALLQVRTSLLQQLFI